MPLTPPPPPRLVGIARMAAEAPSLEAKRVVEYRELAVRSLFNRCSGTRMPFDWTVNPYRGCEFGCKYCYARYTHEFIEVPPEHFEDRIWVKRVLPRRIREELSRIPAPKPIAIGTATDPYQPAERRFRVTRRILEVLAGEGGRRITITTKGSLITRDAELLAAIARRNVLHVNFTVTTLDRDLARLLEPRAPRPDLRLAALGHLRSVGVPGGVFASPVVPALTDAEADLDRLGAAVKRVGGQYFGGNVLFLRSPTREVFLAFAQDRFPRLAAKLEARFRTSSYLAGDYPKMIAERFDRVRARHGLERAPTDYQPAEWEDPQGSLF